MIRASFYLFFTALAVLSVFVNSFSNEVGSLGRSNFVTSPRLSGFTDSSIGPKNGMVMMAGKVANFGIFSPAVYGAKIVLGDAKLKKYRGKAVSLHSQAIGDFTAWAGAGHIRTDVIKLAKKNGNTLGFLV